ncbi:hypothetical protein ACIQXZ_29220 [Bacillus thuringiensis]|uniref:hypothetical protein n=1 Tax=Bacillus thuringiensis TaxID=1428 RepID=UPI0037FF6ED7
MEETINHIKELILEIKERVDKFITRPGCLEKKVDCFYTESKQAIHKLDDTLSERQQV